MVGNNDYDVTKWPVGNPYEDIGEVIKQLKRNKSVDIFRISRHNTFNK